MALVRLIYASRATVPLLREQLHALTAAAARKNNALGITGALVHAGGYFLQMLEGQESAVVDLFAKIAADPRHYDVQRLSVRPILSQCFSGWGMSCLHDADAMRFDTSRVAILLQRLESAPCKEELGDSACVLLEEMKAEIVESTRMIALQNAA
jgi:hypothetical protein